MQKKLDQISFSILVFERTSILYRVVFSLSAARMLTLYYKVYKYFKKDFLKHFSSNYSDILNTSQYFLRLLKRLSLFLQLLLKKQRKL